MKMIIRERDPTPEGVLSNVSNGHLYATLNPFATLEDGKRMYVEVLNELVADRQVDHRKAMTAVDEGRRIWTERVRSWVDMGRGDWYIQSRGRNNEAELLFLADLGYISHDDARMAIERGNVERDRIEAMTA